MAKTLTLAFAQLNVTVGDLSGNAEKIKAAHAAAVRCGADALVTAELALTGYPADDLLLRPAFVSAARGAAERLAAQLGGETALIVGMPWQKPGGKPYNAAVLLGHGQLEPLVFKQELPNYGVFDDGRVFSPEAAAANALFSLKGVRIGFALCEDMWHSAPSRVLKQQGADILVVLNGSPYEMGKPALREQVMAARIGETGLPIAYVNQVGGQDGLVFDGGSVVMDRQGVVQVRADSFAEAVLVTHWEKQAGRWQPQPGTKAAAASAEASLYAALLLGLRDYVEKNQFTKVLLGLSGGVDSAFVAALAVDALGADKVDTVMLPSPYTSAESMEAAAEVAGILGCGYRSIGLGEAMAVLHDLLRPHQQGVDTDIADQNVQSRLRGLMLMALSNSWGHLLLATGNKSEMAVGYATLYGDMCGGYAPIKDVYKTTLYRLSVWRNQHLPMGALGKAGIVIPPAIIDRPPTAELKPGQTDQDNLPPYPLLDAILQGLIEEALSAAQLVAAGYDADTVKKVAELLGRAEYKRQQAPPGVKVTAKAFGRDRRYPITNRFKP